MRRHLAFAMNGPLRRGATATGVLALALLAVIPANAVDNPPAPQGPKGCPLFEGPEGQVPTVPHGTLKTVAPGLPPLPGIFAPGVYMCSNGVWMLVAPWQGPGTTPVFMEGAPTVAADTASVSVAEGGVAANTGTIAYTGTGTVVLSASVGTVTAQGDGTWSWSYAATDGPSQAQNVAISATADDKVGSTTFELVVGNVAPTVVSVSPDRATALVGRPVTFTGTAADPSVEDTAAGFTWAFDGAAATGGPFTRSFASCGTYTVTARATDKDGGTSTETVSGAVTVASARFVGLIRGAAHHVVPAGLPIPISVEVSCAGVPVRGLSPSITLIKGVVDAATDTDDPTRLVPVCGWAGASTTGRMVPLGPAYHYIVCMPAGPANALYTVRVRPFEGSTDAVYSVVQLWR